MKQPLYTQHTEVARTETIGVRGARGERLRYWREQLPAQMATLTTRYAKQYHAIVDLPTRGDDLAEIESVARHIRAHFSTLLVIGMGGSSLGAQVLSSLAPSGGLRFEALDNIDPYTFSKLAGRLDWPKTAFLIVSKSGGTVEVHALVGALFAEAKSRGLDIAAQCFCITIPDDNPLHRFAQRLGMRVIAHDADLCGRFSIFSAVGLIPAAVLGLDIFALRAGAAAVLAQNTPEQGAVAEGAALAMALADQGAHIQVLMHYTDRLEHFVAWCRQCWSESLGKDGKGTLLVRSRGVTEQHSQLQLYLDGPADKYFTALIYDTRGAGPEITFPSTDDTRLSYLQSHQLGDLIFAEQRGTNDTLVEAGCPLRSFRLTQLDETVMGGLLMHFTLETIYTAALMGVNPFNQPAVESGKKKALAYLEQH